WAGMNKRYAKRYPAFHEGMVEIIEIPNYRLVFFHTGNDHTDTRGCPLTGSYWELVNGDYRVMGSRPAYEFVYAKLVAEMRKGNERLLVVTADHTAPGNAVPSAACVATAKRWGSFRRVEVVTADHTATGN